MKGAGPIRRIAHQISTPTPTPKPVCFVEISHKSSYSPSINNVPASQPHLPPSLEKHRRGISFIPNAHYFTQSINNLLGWVLGLQGDQMQFLPKQIRTETRREEHLATDGAADRARGDDEPHDDADGGQDL